MDARIVFFGSPEFSLPTLKILAKDYSVVGVVTQPDRPAGRGRRLHCPPIKEFALDFDIPVIQPQKVNHSEAINNIKLWNPNIIIVVAYGQILGSEILNITQHGCLNVHASLLPRWRGAAPIQAAILNGDPETGVTIMKMDPGMDTGPILKQSRIQIQPDDTGGSLSMRLSEMGAELLVKTLDSYLRGEISLKPQDEKKATYAPMLKKSDGFLDQNMPAEVLARKVRAFNPWPGTFIHWHESIIKIHRAYTHKVRQGEYSKIKGDHTIVDGFPALVTQEGLLLLETVQPAGGRIMSGDIFLQGVRNW